MSQTMRDAALAITRALPNGAATVNTGAGGLELKAEAKREFHAHCEFEVSAPALAVGVLANDATCKYSVIHGDAADLSDASLLYGDVITQTGAGGAGAAAASTRLRVPSSVKRFIGLRIIKSGSGDATALSATLRVLS